MLAALLAAALLTAISRQPQQALVFLAILVAPSLLMAEALAGAGAWFVAADGPSRCS